MSANRICGFEPVFREDARILICGSMPSVASLEQQFYYGHPRNAFWRIISETFGEALPVTIEEKRALLIRRRIALWDTAASCEREGSLDSAIRNVVANDFEWLFRCCPGIGAIFFNGAASMALYRKLVRKEDPSRQYIRLPSTSPAYTMPYEQKKRLWSEKILEVLEHESM